MSKVENSLPPSREVRLEDGVTHGVYEHLIFAAHTGNTGDLLHAMAGAELTDELRRSEAVRSYKLLLMSRMMITGTLVTEDLNRFEELWHENEILGTPFKFQEAVEDE